MDQRMSQSLIHIKIGAYQQTITRTQRVYVYMAVYRMSTNHVDPSTENIYEQKKSPFTIATLPTSTGMKTISRQALQTTHPNIRVIDQGANKC